MRASGRLCRRLGPGLGRADARLGSARLGAYVAEYVVLGRGDPCVVVPGLAGGYELAGRVIDALSRDFEVISYQLRGERECFGFSRDFGLRELAQDLKELLEYLGIERAAVLGLSFGSAVSLEFALKHSHRLTALVLQGADTRFRPGLVREIAWPLLLRVPLPHDRPVVNQFFNLLLGDRQPSNSLAEFVARCCWGTDQTVIAQRLGMLMDFDVADQLWRISTPTLVVGAPRDPFASEQGQRRLVDGIAGSRHVVIPDGGHLCFLTRPRLFCEHCADFLRSVLSVPV